MALNAGLGFNLSASDNASFVFAKVGKSLGVLQKNAQDTGLEFDKLTGRVRDASTGRFAKQEGIMSPQWLEGLKGSLGQLGNAAGAMGQRLGGVLSMAADEATKFGLSIGKVASITDRATFPMATIESITKDMAATYGGDINLQADTFYQAVSSGANDAASAIALMHNANKLAIGGLSNSFAAVDALTNVLNAYGMKMTQAGEVSDALFTTAKIGKTTIDELASQIGRVAPTANAMGVSMDEMFAVVTAGSSQLGNAAAPIDGLKESLANILKPSSEATKEAKRLGISFTAAELRSKGFKGFLDSITGSAKYNADTMGKLFGSMTAFNTMSVLASNGGKGLTDALDGMANKAGATDYAFNTLADTADFAKKQLQGNLQTALVSIGQVIAPVLGMILLGVNRVVKAFNNAPPFVQKLVTVMIIGAAGAAMLTAGLVGVALAMAAAYVVGTPLLFALGGVAAALALAAAAAIPFIAVGAAIYTAWDKNIGGFKDKVLFYFDKVKLAFSALGQLFSSGAFSGQVLKDLNNGNAGVKGFAITVFLWFSRIKNFVNQVGVGFAAGLQIIKPAITSLVATFGKLMARFAPVGDSADVAKGKFASFGAMGMKVGVWLAKGVGFIASAIDAVLTYVDKFIAGYDLLMAGSGGLGAAFGDLFSAFTPILDAFGIGTNGATGFSDILGVLGAVIGGVLGFAVRTLVMTMGLFNGALSIAGGLIGFVLTAVNFLYRSVFALGKILYQVLTGDLTGALQTSKALVGDTINAMIDMFASLVLGVAGAADSIANIFGKKLGAKDLVAGYVASLKGAAAAATGTTVGAASGDPSQSPAAIAQSQQLQAAALTHKDVSLPQAAPPPINATINTKLQVDGNTLAESTDKAKLDAFNRGHGPTPPPT